MQSVSKCPSLCVMGLIVPPLKFIHWGPKPHGSQIVTLYRDWAFTRESSWSEVIWWVPKDWCWSWNFNTLATWCEELTHWKRPWCWERLKAGGEGDDREWDGWMASPTQWTWIWINSGSPCWTGRPGVLQFMGWQRVGHDWVTELNWTESNITGILFKGKICTKRETCVEGRPREERWKTVICKPQRIAWDSPSLSAPGRDPLQPLELWDSRFLLLILPDYGASLWQPW